MKIKDAKNLGIRCEKWCAEIHVHTLEDLEKMGIYNAWVQIKLLHSSSVNVILLYAFWGALHDMHWHMVPPEIKKEMRTFVDAFLA